MNLEKYTKMPPKEKKNILNAVIKETFTINYQSEIAKKALDSTASLLKKHIDGEPVNINQLPENIEVVMRLYKIDGLYFESAERLQAYCQANNKDASSAVIFDYIREVAGYKDVIRKTKGGISVFYTAIDAYGYGIYDNGRSIYVGDFVWSYHHGSIAKMYEPFREKGIVFENDIYANVEKMDRHLLEYTKEHNLFNMGTKSSN